MRNLLSLSRSATALILASGLLSNLAVAQVDAREIQKLPSPNPTVLGQFGTHVDICGDTAVVGEANYSIFPEMPGNAWVYVRSGGTWSMQAHLLPSVSQTLDWFGAVSLAGDSLAIGAQGHTGPNGEEGSVFLYERSGSAWTEVAQLFAGDASQGGGQSFGVSTRMEEDLLFVAAGPDQGDPLFTGSVYVFVRSGGVWTQTAKLKNPIPSMSDRFGLFSIDYDGDTLAIGSPGPSNPAAPLVAGDVNIFRRNALGWTHEAALVPAAAALGDHFGSSVDLHGNTLVVGAREEVNGGPGSAWVFSRSGTTWSEVARLTADDGVGGDAFGTRVATNGNIAIITAPLHAAVVDFGGAAYIFERNGDLWTQTTEFEPGDLVLGDQFGRGLALDGTTALMGSPWVNAGTSASATGAAYFFEIAGATIGNRICFGDGGDGACPCGNSSAAGSGEGCVNSSGLGARLSGYGSMSVTADDLLMEASRLPASTFALLFSGTQSQSGAAVGSGLLCAGGANLRLGVRASNPAGQATWGLGLAAQAGVMAGDTRVLQVAYRDPVGSPCGAPFNYTSALQVSFTP
ncbi:MAG: hypothetical protein ACI8QC_002679 [Planctomycetota bacterium]|jgi:hypothetical protein